jgi:acylpyruvate hydrolase
MRLLSHEGPDGVRASVVRDDRAVDLADLGIAGLPGTLDALIGGDRHLLPAIERALAGLPEGAGRPLVDLTLAPPFQPRIIICGGANFADHLDETHRAKPDHVEFFLKSPTGVIGAGRDVRMDPRLSHKYDYEVELGVVIGRTARDVPRERAFEHVFGYTIINDVSIRDQQVIPWDEGRFQLRFGEGKSYQDSAPLGPWIVTADELTDVSGLALRTRVAGVLRQNNSMRNIIWDVPALISYYSTYMTLEPGFLIACGTPGGPALGSDIELGADPYERSDGVSRGAYVPDGALVECEIEGIGTLANRYVIAS